MHLVKITAGGRLMSEEWNSESKEAYYTDMTDRALFCMDSECVLDKGIRLWDIFCLVKNINLYPILSPMFTHAPNWLEQIIEEGLCPKESFVDRVVLGWEGSINTYGGSPELSVWQHLYGVKNDSNDKWGFSFSSTSDFTDTEIVLDTKFTLYDERKEANKNRTKEEKKQSHYAPLAEINKIFTLYEVLHGIFYDLSFHGGPYERDIQSKELDKIKKEIDEGMVKPIPAKEVFSELGLDDED